MPVKQVLVFCKDASFSPATALALASRATAEALLDSGTQLLDQSVRIPLDGDLAEWLESFCPTQVVMVPDDAALFLLHAKARSLQLPCSRGMRPGLEPGEPAAYDVVALGPCSSEALDCLIGEFPVL